MSKKKNYILCTFPKLKFNRNNGFVAIIFLPRNLALQGKREVYESLPSLENNMKPDIIKITEYKCSEGIRTDNK